MSSSSDSADCKCPVFIRVDEGGVKCVLDWDESVVQRGSVCEQQDKQEFKTLFICARVPV